MTNTDKPNDSEAWPEYDLDGNVDFYTRGSDGEKINCSDLAGNSIPIRQNPKNGNYEIDPSVGPVGPRPNPALSKEQLDQHIKAIHSLFAARAKQNKKPFLANLFHHKNK